MSDHAISPAVVVAAIVAVVGRDLDVLVAEHAMGFRRVVDETYDYDHVQHRNEVLLPPGETLERLRDWLPRKGQISLGYFVTEHYSASIAAAWKVVERFERLGYTVAMHTTAEGWVCSFRGATLADSAQAPTLPLAICLSALKSSGYEVAP